MLDKRRENDSMTRWYVDVDCRTTFLLTGEWVNVLCTTQTIFTIFIL